MPLPEASALTILGTSMIHTQAVKRKSHGYVSSGLITSLHTHTHTHNQSIAFYPGNILLKSVQREQM